VTLLQLQLPALLPAQLAGLVAAVAALGLRPSDAWLLQFLSASQRRLLGAAASELAGCLSGVAALSAAGAAAARPAPRWLEAVAGEVRAGVGTQAVPAAAAAAGWRAPASLAPGLCGTRPGPLAPAWPEAAQCRRALAG
jgi:hypothetical protein